MTIEPTTAVEQLLPELRRYAWSLTGRIDRADDLLEECLQQRLWRAGPPEPAAERARLFKSLRTCFIRDRRSWGTETMLQEPAGAWAAARERGRLAGLRLAFARLPGDRREVLNLVVMDGMSYEEAGAILEVSPATVRLRVALARSELVQEIAGDGITIRRAGPGALETAADDDLPTGGGDREAANRGADRLN